MTGAKKVLFVGPCKWLFRSFMQWDLEILKEEFRVRPVNVCFDWQDIGGTLKTALSLIAGIAWADVVFCWFASREAFPTIALFKRCSEECFSILAQQRSGYLNIPRRRCSGSVRLEPKKTR
jgi:hypothetical protein